MRKPLLPGIFAFLALYAAVFVFLTAVQFGGQSNFTHNAGGLFIQGRYGNKKGVMLPNTYALDGGLDLFFGGMEFDLGWNDKEHFTIGDAEGTRPARPELLTLTAEGAYIQLEGGAEVSFINQFVNGALELTIQADFSSEGRASSEETAGMETTKKLTIPCKPLGSSAIQPAGNSFLVSAADGFNYVFTRNLSALDGPPDPESGFSGWLISLGAESYNLAYRAVPEQQSAEPADFILASAQDNAKYEAALLLWRDKSFLAWNRAAASSDTDRLFALGGEAANAYLSETLKRGTYRPAAAAIAALYTPSSDSWETSAYAGKTEAASRFLAASDRERYTRFARLLNERSINFLREYQIIEFLGTRGYGSLLDDAAGILRSFDPALVKLEQSAGLLEGRFEWEQVRSERENPYLRFIDQAIYVVSAGLQTDRSTGNVLVFSENEANAEFNLRLGAALGRFTGNETWQALGKSLVLSVLALADDAGSVPETLIQNETGEFAEKAGSGRLDPGRIYRLCKMGDYYVQAAAALQSAGIWAWTAAQAVQAEQTAQLTSITVNFPVGETHYMILRGIRPFARVQIHGVDYQSNSQFDRYDASGWDYLAQDQTLLLKIRHRLSAENIRILQTPAPQAVEPNEAEE